MVETVEAGGNDVKNPFRRTIISVVQTSVEVTESSSSLIWCIPVYDDTHKL